MFGIGLALAVVLDAVVVRSLLVPATMRLAGGANWWAPRPLRRIHDRFGLKEHPVYDGVTEEAVTAPVATPARSDRR